MRGCTKYAYNCRVTEKPTNKATPQKLGTPTDYPATSHHYTAMHLHTLHILVVDDEALARSRLRTLLGDCNLPAAVMEGQKTHMVVTEAANAGEALALLRQPTTPHLANGWHGVDVLLLDIHMPGQDGLQLAHAVRALPMPPAIVFITAHADHAVSAFELDAVDYLTKPVRLERLQQALAKVQRHTGQAVTAPTLPPMPMAAHEVLLIQDRGRTERLPLAEVVYFKAELKYVTVRTTTKSHVMDTSLNDLEHRYGAKFLRIHRNALVARRALRALEKHHDAVEGDGWAVRLQGVTELVMVSRRQVSAVREALEG
jgi:two-component system response regulator AlgR